MMAKYDVCIVGSGAGGAPIAYELSLMGYSVIVLEKGKEIAREQFSKDELALRRDIYRPSLQEEFHIIHFKGKRYDGREWNWSFWNGSLLGGASNFMSGYFHRLKPMDFKLLSTFGPIEKANIVDWPISYDEMEPFYTKVENIVGVSGKVVEHPFLEPRGQKDFPYPPLEENIASIWFDEAAKRLRLHSIPTPRTILSKNTPFRKSCYYSNFCGSYGCSSGAKGSAREALLNRSNATILTQAFVYRLESDRHRVKKAHFFDKNGSSHTIEAKIFVLAATPIESARLLLNSKNSFFPHGLGNNSMQVGKNLIFSAGGTGEGIFYKDRLPPSQSEALFTPGLFLNRSLQEWYIFQKGGKSFKGGTIDFLFEHANIIPRAMNEIYDEKGDLLWGRKLQEKMHKNIPNQRKIRFEIFCDWLPTDGGFVTIAKEKDKFGAHVADIHIDPHPHDLFVGRFLAKRGMSVLKEMGAKKITTDISFAPPTNLVAGGCRFGNDPKKSVLNSECRCHELENCYIADASFMPTGGSVPYTWTIYANSFRIAEAIKRELR